MDEKTNENPSELAPSELANVSDAYENLEALPTPVEKDDGTIQMEDLKAEDIFDAIISTNDEGYAASAIISTIEKVHTDIHPTPENPQANREVIQTVSPEYCVVSIYALNDNIWIVELVFDTKDDAYLVELRDQLSRYQTMVMAVRQRVMRDHSYNPKDIPIYTLTFVPYKFGGFGVGSFGDPIDFYEVDKENGKRGLHILFSPDSMSFEQIDMTKDELSDIQAEVMREDEEKQNTVYRSSF